jgi:hypothetical protein
LYGSIRSAEQVKSCWEKSQARKLIELLLSHGDVIMAKPNDRDIEGAYQVRGSCLKGSIATPLKHGHRPSPSSPHA